LGRVARESAQVFQEDREAHAHLAPRSVGFVDSWVRTVTRRAAPRWLLWRQHRLDGRGAGDLTLVM